MTPEPVVFRHDDTIPGTGVRGYSAGARFLTEIGVIEARRPHTGHVVLLTRFDDTVLTPTNAIQLGLRLIGRGLAGLVGR